MTTPIDRESVERLADWLRDDDLHEAAQHHVADTLLALRAALDEAEAERHRWRQAASIGSIHTQADLDRAVNEARAVALEEALNKVSGCDRVSEVGPAIRALIDKPTAEALKRVRAEEREGIATILDAKASGYEEAHNMAGDWEHAVKTAAAQTAKELRHQAKTILALIGKPTAEALERVRAEAYLSGWVNGSNGVELPDFGNPVFDDDAIRARGEGEG